MITDNIGIELEVEDVQLSRVKIPDLFYSTHDASCESSVATITKINSTHRLTYESSQLLSRNGRQTSTVGGEYVSKHPLRYSEDQKEPLESSLKTLISNLIESGEKPFSYRGSLHCHVNFPVLGSIRALTILKNTLILGSHLEEMFFHLGGMGYTFRGIKVNNSIYCRPITGKGPQIVGKVTPTGMRNVQVFNVPDLLEASSLEDFLRRLGNIRSVSNVDRYHPARYCWLNLYSILLHGTLEYRVFNKTLSSPLILAVVKLCQEISYDLITNTNSLLELESNSIFDSKDSSTSLDLLDKYLSRQKKLHYLSPEDIDLLMFTIANSELKGSDFTNKYVYTHLRRWDDTSGRWLYNSEEEYCPTTITDKVDRSNFVDIHNMYS